MFWIKVPFFVVNMSNCLYHYYFTFISSQPRLTTSIYPRSSLDYITLWKMHSLMHFLTTSPCAVKSNTKSHILLFMFHSLRAFFFSWMKKKEEKKKRIFKGASKIITLMGFESQMFLLLENILYVTHLRWPLFRLLYCSFFRSEKKKNLSSKLLIDYVHIFSILQDNADYSVDVLAKICHSICICILVFCMYLVVLQE